MFFSEVLLLSLITVLTCFYTFYNWSLSFWKKRNVKSLPTKFPLGNMENPLTSQNSMPIIFYKFYKKLKGLEVKHGGVYMFTSPIYMPIDLDIVKLILTQDYQYFNSRGFYVHEDQAVSQHLFALENDRWKNMRRKLTPTFTSGKMKMMFDTVVKCTDPIPNEIEKCKNGIVNIKQILARYTIDTIGSCAFGIDCNSFENSDTDFIKYSTRIVRPTYTEVVKDMVCFALPKLATRLNLKPFNVEAADFFYNMVDEVVKHRMKNNITRKDFIQMLIDLKNGKDIDGEAFNIDVVAAQCFLFFIAGFETSSSTMTFCLYQLSKNEDIQKKVRDEINEVLSRHNGEINYDAIMEMKYMNQVIDETLRMYPSVPLLTRRCTADYKLPNHDLVIKKGMTVGISAMGIQYDSDYYTNPSKFDPDRFSDENKKSRNPYSFLPFGEGPRLCLGMRFGMMQTKIGIYSMLRNYQLTINSRTDEPLEFESSFLLSAKGDIWLNATKIK